MIKLFIVDDESIIRKGIRYFIDWKNFEVEVVGEASNGMEALETIFSLHPDILITDIRMPKMNGLEFITEVKKIMPTIKIIMLSGYSDTEYFTKAISLGVSEFIFKSADSKEIVNAVEKIAKQILVERQEETRLNAVYRVLDYKYLQLAFGYMKDLMDGANISVVKEYLNSIDISINGPNYYFMHIGNIENKEDQSEIISVLNYMLSLFNPFIAPVNKSVVCLVNCDSKGIELAFFEKISLKIQSKYSPILISDKFDDLCNIKAIYENMLELSNRSCWFKDKHIVYVSEVNFVPIQLSEILNMEKEIISDIKNNQSANAMEKLEVYFHTLRSDLVSINDVTESGKRIIISICCHVNKYDDVERYFVLINKDTPIESIFQIILELFENSIYKSPQHSITKNTIAIIEENYADNLSLSYIAKKTFVSVSYLSKVFKKEIGVGIKEYINKVRIEKSKVLIKNGDMKIFEIASAVGFRDYKQFSIYFHRFEKMSISEYRRKFM